MAETGNRNSAFSFPATKMNSRSPFPFRHKLIIPLSKINLFLEVSQGVERVRNHWKFRAPSYVCSLYARKVATKIVPSVKSLRIAQ